MCFLAFQQVSEWYELVVFTASMEIYGAAVAEKLDRNRGILKRRYYRQVSFAYVDIYKSYYFSCMSLMSLYPTLMLLATTSIV
jgi:TFIIF-interacting CTD phosphatase-like protein